MEQELYRKMYAVWCGSISEAIDALRDPRNCLYARNVIGTAILKAEEMYLSAEDEEELTQ